MDKVYSVKDLSEIMNKSSSTIYDYLKKGKLQGKKVNGVWEVNYSSDKLPEGNDNTGDDINEPSIDSKIVVNGYVYKNTLQKSIAKYESILEDLNKQLINEANINMKLASIQGPTKFTNELAKSADVIAKSNKVYNYTKLKIEELSSKLSNLVSSYKELNYIIEPLLVERLQYSKSSDSVYVDINKDNLVILLNRLSEISKRFVIVKDDLTTLDVIKLRFSNHIPEYYQKGTLSLLEDKREVDIIIPYSNLEENIDVMPEGQTSEDKKVIKGLIEKMNVAKKYSDKKVKSLNKKQLEHYYQLTKDLLSDENAKNNGFVKSLKYKQVAILKQLRYVS